jgi:prolyl-tRNA editing enzyme YbaK/EbsC (Cys-tRNA(Pro) deacylase)
VVRYLLTESQRVSKDNGGIPPFGHSTQLRVFVDPDLLQYDEVWAAAGTWNDNFGAAPADIVRVASGVVTDLKRV